MPVTGITMAQPELEVGGDMQAARLFSVGTFILLATILAGCQGAWNRPGTSSDELSFDRDACEQRAVLAYPENPVPRTVYPGGLSTYNTTCLARLNNSNCASVGSGFSQLRTTTVDANLSNRNASFGACMEARGYQFDSGFK